MRHRLFELLRRFRSGSLVTRTAEGQMHARPMSVATLDDSAEELGFLVLADSDVAAEVTADPSVTVVFQDTRHHVCWSGRAEIERERYRVVHAWQPDVGAWFPEGPEDPRLVLLVVRGARAEYWSSSIVAGTLRALERAAGTGGPREPKPESPTRHGVVDFELDTSPSGW
jgi:general stress protein 26